MTGERKIMVSEKDKRERQREADKRWIEKNKEHRRYLSQRGAARSFIRNHATEEDLKELEKIIAEKNDLMSLSTESLTKKGAEYLQMLPEKEKSEAVELLKKLVIAWDPDFTKLTEQEKKELEEAKEDKEYFDFKDVYKDLMDK